MKFKVLVVDDEPIARDVIKSYIAQVNSLELTGEFENAIDSHSFIKSHRVDLIFLDIKMPELSGIEFLRSLKNPPRVIITTAYREYALEGYELQIVDYLLKPISFKRFIKAIDHFHDMVPILGNQPSVEIEQSTKYLYIRDNRKINKCSIDEILYIESRGEYVRYYTADKKYMTKGSLSQLEKELPRSVFLRIHNSFIVAIDKVNAFTNSFVEVGGETLPISRKYRELAIQYLKK
jgi:DNA-binding LytR/AlgR family response regulator